MREREGEGEVEVGKRKVVLLKGVGEDGGREGERGGVWHRSPELWKRWWGGNERRLLIQSDIFENG